jgi:hypothetical protein
LLPLISPPLHGELGFWDEVVCLIPSLVLIGLIVYVALAQRRKRQSPAEAGGEPPEEGDL